MSKRVARGVSVAAVLLLGATASLYAHDPEKKSPMDSMCEGHHAQAMKASDQVNAHLAEAKRSGTLAEMRKHVELAEKAMAEMGKHMSLCMGMMEKMHGGMGTMGGGMKSGGTVSGSRTVAGEIVDPVCGMTVDAASAPSATYKGQTYSFCSEGDKKKFQTNPEQYIKPR